MTRPPWTCKTLEQVVVALVMKAMPSGADQAWYTIGADAHCGPAENSESRCDTWMDKRLVPMKTIGRYGSIASRGLHGPNGEQVGEYAGRMLANRNRFGQNLQDVHKVAHCRGQHVSGIKKDTVSDVENGFPSELWDSDIIGYLSDLKPIHLRWVTKRWESSGTSPGFGITTGLLDEPSKHTSTVS